MSLSILKIISTNPSQAPETIKQEKAKAFLAELYKNAWLVSPKIDDEGMDCIGDCVCYIKFSDPTIPAITTNGYCISGIPDNLGDLNKDGKDEIGLVPDWFTSCWRCYYVWTLKNNV